MKEILLHHHAFKILGSVLGIFPGNAGDVVFLEFLSCACGAVYNALYCCTFECDGYGQGW